MSIRINVVTLWLMDPEGKSILTGGVERWSRDISLLLAENKYDVFVYQKGHKNFKRCLSDKLTVVGIKCDFSFLGNFQMSRWLDRNLNHDDPVIFVSQELGLFCDFKNAIAVNHGIWWNGDFPSYKKYINKYIQKSFLNKFKSIICVDSNYINWCHAEFSNRNEWQHKLKYIPNYADVKLFKNILHDKNDKFVILFPRRMSGASLNGHPRGLGFFLDALDIIFSKGLRPFVIFAGRGPLQCQVLNWAEERNYADNILIDEFDLDGIAKIYNEASVVVIPTIAQEGTSFSAIEALVSGRSTVVTHIGGLPNIVIDGLNGYVSDLSPNSLAEKIIEASKNNLIEQNHVNDVMRRVFCKEAWEGKILKEVNRLIL